MKNLEAGFLFRCINLIVGLEVRGQPSPQLYSDEGMVKPVFGSRVEKQEMELPKPVLSRGTPPSRETGKGTA